MKPHTFFFKDKPLAKLRKLLKTQMTNIRNRRNPMDAIPI